MRDPLLDAELLPPRDRPELVGRRVFGLLADAVADKAARGLHERWAKNRRLGRDLSPVEASADGVRLVRANFLHAHRQRAVNVLTDNQPTFNVTRVGEAENEEIYRTMERLARHWWNEQEQQAVLERAVINGETYGAAVEKVVFDPDMEFGLGEVRTLTVDPFQFAVHPADCLDVQDAEAVFHFRTMSLREARRRWPDKAAQLVADAALLAEVGDARLEAAKGAGTLGAPGLGVVVGALLRGGGRARLAPDEVVVCECWARDYFPEGDGFRYPGCIRRVTVANGGRLVLEDRGNPSINPLLAPAEAARTYLYDKFPFILANSLTDPSSLWGSSDFEQLCGLQREINTCLTQLAYHKDRCARPKIVNPRDSGVANAAFTNRQGVVNPTSMAAAQGIRYLDFTNNSNDIEAVLAIYKDLFHQIAGGYDLEQARDQATPVVAYRAVSALLEQAAVMMRGKIRNYSKLIRERGRMFLSHAQNWYAEKRWIAFSEGGRTGAMAVAGEALRVPARLTVVSGSTMPASRVQQREEALALYEMGAVDRRELLEKLDWPGWAETAARMDAREGPAGAGRASDQAAPREDEHAPA